MLLCHSVSYYFRMLTLIFHLLSAHIWYARCPCNDNRGMPLHFSSPLFFFSGFWWMQMSLYGWGKAYIEGEGPIARCLGPFCKMAGEKLKMPRATSHLSPPDWAT